MSTKKGITSEINWNDDLINQLISSKTIQVGIVDEEKAKIGQVHEYGLGDNPRRSFLQDPITKNKKVIENHLAQQSQGLNVAPQDDNLIKSTGEWIVNQIVKPAFNNNSEWETKVDGTKATLGDLKDYVVSQVKKK